MQETLKKNPKLKILAEFSPKQIREHRLKPEDVLIQFLNYNYKIYPITSQGERIISIDYNKSIPEEIMKIGHGLNLFCKKE